MGLHLLWCFLLFLWLQQLLQGPLHLQNLKNFVAMPSVHNVRHVRLVYRWRKSAEPGSSIHLIHCPSIPDHLRDVLRSSQRHAAELTLWSAKLVSQMSPRKNSAEGTLTHMSALRSLGAKKCCWYGKWEKKSKCEKKSPVTHPDNCYSSIWNTEIRHGEMGARKCCWYGKWEKKSKCNGGHKDD